MSLGYSPFYAVFSQTLDVKEPLLYRCVVSPPCPGGPGPPVPHPAPSSPLHPLRSPLA